ncbi:MAG: DUF1295 domain-containing protein [Candidatus Marinimicrobia bacterium]|nr:DUF1295 domain-containing protein [Candidatus Neomarinimicrobiota bacterium]
MGFWNILLNGSILVLILMTVLWIVSIIIKNVSIVDTFWGLGFVMLTWFYYFQTEGLLARKIILLVLVTVWGLRLSLYIGWRNWGEGEDYRYQNFRKKYGKKYWWFSFFQTFLLQGVLMILISAPLLGAQLSVRSGALNFLDYIAIGVWLIGFIFEAGGDLQMARFKSDPSNEGQVMRSGFWRYTRHPNYFGDSAQWWAYGLFSLAAGSYWPVLGSLMMTFLLIKVSGVALLEKSLKDKKPKYKDYIEKTSAFIPWFPKQ